MLPRYLYKRENKDYNRWTNKKENKNKSDRLLNRKITRKVSWWKKRVTKSFKKKNVKIPKDGK